MLSSPAPQLHPDQPTRHSDVEAAKPLRPRQVPPGMTREAGFPAASPPFTDGRAGGRAGYFRDPTAAFGGPTAAFGGFGGSQLHSLMSRESKKKNNSKQEITHPQTYNGRPSVSLAFSVQLSSVLETLRSNNNHFGCHFLPHLQSRDLP